MKKNNVKELVFLKSSEFYDQKKTGSTVKGEAQWLNLSKDATMSVEPWIEFYSKKAKHTVKEWLKHSHKFKKTIASILRSEGVPEQLFYLAMIESGLKAHTSSLKQAKGWWQFTPQTARVMGLTVKPNLDERSDLVKSTRAAARYLKQLNLQFNDWYLTVAAYNAGPAKIKQLIKKYHSSDFWLLVRQGELRKETAQLVPKILAAMLICENPTGYGFKI